MNATDLQNATAEDILAWTYRRFGRVAMVASFQAESLVLIDLACGIVPEPEVLTLDTGRLHEETHDYIEYVRTQFPIRLRILAPDAKELEDMTSEHGDMLFRQSVPLRNQCCAVRKVNPLARALRDYDAWITGLRRDQTPTRAATPVVASDPGHDGMTKVVPLATWSRDQVWDYLRAQGIRHHPLYDRGYMSIGCEPGYLGVAHRAFTPSGPDMANLTLANGVTMTRSEDRRGLLQNFDNIRREVDATGTMAPAPRP